MMNTKTLTEDQQIKLRKPLPSEAVSVHPTKPYLSSIKSIYVTERFNEVFGIGGWNAEAKVIDANEGAPVVYVTFEAPEYGIKLSQFGGNDNGGVNAKNYDLGDAYKGAFTDALTKIASYMDVGADVFKGLQKGGETKPKTNSKEEKPDLPFESDEEEDDSEQPETSGVQSTIDSFKTKTELIEWWKKQMDSDDGTFRDQWQPTVFAKLEDLK